jgi:ubiquinone/menaquinone biosynthesis C-methylase UbiE
MSDQSRPYAIHSDNECDRLERQAVLAGLDRHIASLAALPPPTCVLDAGCGSGSMARLLAAHYPNARVVGVDLRADYLDYARARAEAEGLDNLSFQQGDIFSLPFSDGAFELVWSKYVLQWTKEPALAVAELRRVTKAGGSVVCCNFDGFAVTHWPEEEALQRDVNRVFEGLVDPFVGRKMASFFLDAGFEDISVQFEPDRLFTVVGQIDPDRRHNWVEQLTAARAPYRTHFGRRAGSGCVHRTVSAISGPSRHRKLHGFVFRSGMRRSKNRALKTLEFPMQKLGAEVRRESVR